VGFWLGPEIVILKCGRAEIWDPEVRVVLYIHNCCWFCLFF